MNVSQATRHLDYWKGFKLLFEDANIWINLALGSLFILIPIVGPIMLMGWQAEIFRRLHTKTEPFLPKLDFSDLAYYLSRGIYPFLVSLVLIIPMIFIILISLGILAALYPLMIHQGHVVSVPLALTFIGVILLIAVVLFIFLFVITNAGVTRAYLTQNFGKSFQFGEIFSYGRATWGNVTKAICVYVPISFVFLIAGMIMLYVGIYPASVIMNVAWVYIAWQIYEIYLEQGGKEIPMEPIPEKLPSENLPQTPMPPPNQG